MARSRNATGSITPADLPVHTTVKYTCDQHVSSRWEGWKRENRAAFSKKLSTHDGAIEERSANRSRESIGGRGLRSEIVKDRAVVVGRARTRKKSTQVGANEREVGHSCLTSTQIERGKTGPRLPGP